MNILLIGRWGKSHAIAKALEESIGKRDKIFSYMDKPNAGIVDIADDYRLDDMDDIDSMINYAKKVWADLVIAIPHMTLVEGAADELVKNGFRTIGPLKQSSKLETDKGFLRDVLKKLKLDVSPKNKVFKSARKAEQFIEDVGFNVAVKPVGVTEGDGVKVVGVQLKNKGEAIDYVHEIFKQNIGGIARVIIEERLVGEEFTIQAFCDGKTVVGMPMTRDYKLLNEGEKGLNTPGMGSISFPDHLMPGISSEVYNEAFDVMEKVLMYMKDEYEPFVGILSGQFILTEEGVKVIEFNVRPGDSEIFNIIPILKTNFLDICNSMVDGKLDNLDVKFENKATVTKYIVPNDFPYPEKNMQMEIDKKAIEKEGGYLFYSCFRVDDNVYKPGPGGVAVDAAEETLEKANKKCEKLISNYIRGRNLKHRKDIGTEKLLKHYRGKIK